MSILPGLILVVVAFYHSSEASIYYQLGLQDMITRFALGYLFLAARLIFSPGL